MLRNNFNNGTGASFYLSSSGFVIREVFVVVGGLSTGKHIAPLLRGHGYTVVHVQPKRAETLGIMHNEADYIASFSEGNDIKLLTN